MMYHVVKSSSIGITNALTTLQNLRLFTNWKRYARVLDLV